MTFALVLNVIMVMAGAAVFGWLWRWNTIQDNDPIDPRDLARREAERHAANRERSA